MRVIDAVKETKADVSSVSPPSERLCGIKAEQLKPWPNGTSNSSQVTKSKLASAGGQTILRLRSHITIRKQLGESWLRWPNGGKLGSSWAKIRV